MATPPLTTVPGIEPTTTRLGGARSTTGPRRRARRTESGRILPPKWPNSATKVAEFWQKSGRKVAEFWQNSATKVAEFWQKSGRILPQKWQNSGRKVAEKWQNSGTKVAQFCHKSCRILPPKWQNPQGVPRLLIYKQSGHRSGAWRFPSRKCGTLPSGIEPLLGQNSATFLPEFCHFCGRILPHFCHNCATFGAESCRLGGTLYVSLAQW